MTLVESPVIQLTSYVISTDPKISIIPGFLLPEECDHIVNLAETKGFSRSLVGRGQYSFGEDKSEGLSNVYSENRTSTSVNLDRGHDEIVSLIEQGAPFSRASFHR